MSKYRYTQANFEDFENEEYLSKADFEAILDDIETDVKTIYGKLDGIEGIDLIDDAKELLGKLEENLY